MPDEEEVAVVEEDGPLTPKETMDLIHAHLDQLHTQQQETDNSGGLSEDDPDKANYPEDIGSATFKLHKKAEVPKTLEDDYDPNASFFGMHVVNSNTPRIDNLRQLGNYDSTVIVRDIPYMRQYGTTLKIRVTSEFQMCRSNPKIGGFDQEMGRTTFTKEDVDLRQTQNINNKKGEKGGGILGFLGLRRKPV